MSCVREHRTSNSTAVFHEADELGAARASGNEYLVRKASSPLLPPLSWPTPYHLRVRKAMQVLQDRMQRLIEERRGSTTPRNDLFSILLHAQDEDGSQMSDEQLMDECFTLFGAGHETTAAALAWTWAVLCQHPAL